MSEQHGKETAQKPLPRLPHVLMLNERVGKSTVIMLLRTFEKQIVTDITTIQQNQNIAKSEVTSALSLVAQQGPYRRQHQSICLAITLTLFSQIASLTRMVPLTFRHSQCLQ